MKYKPHVTFGIRHHCGVYIYSRVERESHTCNKKGARVNKDGYFVEVSGVISK